MIDAEQAKALDFAPLAFEVERGRLRAFARSIGEIDPIYSNVEAAHAAGHPDLPVPPTFFLSMSLEVDDPFAYLVALGADMRFVLHGEQSFTYHQMVYAGDTLLLQDRIVDIYNKRDGEMEFVVKETTVHRDESLVGTATSVLIVRHPKQMA